MAIYAFFSLHFYFFICHNYHLIIILIRCNSNISEQQRWMNGCLCLLSMASSQCIHIFMIFLCAIQQNGDDDDGSLFFFFKHTYISPLFSIQTIHVAYAFIHKNREYFNNLLLMLHRCSEHAPCTAMIRSIIVMRIHILLSYIYLL